MKKDRKVFVFLFACILTLIMNGCVGLACSVVEGLADAVVSPILESKGETDDLIEEHIIGENTVQLHITVYKNLPGYLFTATDRNHQELGKVFYYAGDESGMKRYKRFKKMNTADKKQFICEDFLKYANVDLAPIESEEVDAVTEAKSDSSL